MAPGDVVGPLLSGVFPPARQPLPTPELLHPPRGEGGVPAPGLRRLLQDVDLGKLAARLIPAVKAREIGTEARALVDAVEEALSPPEERRAA